MHRYRRGQGFESRTSLIFSFSGFLFATAKSCVYNCNNEVTYSIDDSKFLIHIFQIRLMPSRKKRHQYINSPTYKVPVFIKKNKNKNKNKTKETEKNSQLESTSTLTKPLHNVFGTVYTQTAKVNMNFQVLVAYLSFLLDCSLSMMFVLF